MRAASKLRLTRPLTKKEPVIRHLYSFHPHEWRAVDALAPIVGDHAACEAVANICGPLRIYPEPALPSTRELIHARRTVPTNFPERWALVTDEQAEEMAKAVAAALEST